MIKIKPQNPKGVRDYLPVENKNREYILTVLKQQFELFGFQAIHIPAFERLETLMGKYGEEGEQLLFKILNSGNYIDAKVLKQLEEDAEKTTAITQLISSKGLRYDLTVPLARFVAQHQNELTFPFKRYHIAPVWRADRPQKGRYQEFYQCDVDVVGSQSLVSDVELINLIDCTFNILNVKVEIKINNRKIFNGICEILSIQKKTIRVSTILDKWDKIGEVKVVEELSNIISKEQTEKLISLLTITTIEEFENTIAASYTSNLSLQEGLEEIKYIFQYTASDSLQFDLRLLRGLDYYTGTVVEVISTEMSYGSICGGGRYDNLTEIFGMKDVSGIGISFGLDRVYDVMTELGKFPKEENNKKVLILNLSERAIVTYFQLLQEIRDKNIIVDLYPTNTKMDKQLSYADKCNYTHAIIIGEEEVVNNEIQIKDLKKREQFSLKASQIIDRIIEL